MQDVLLLLLYLNPRVNRLYSQLPASICSYKTKKEKSHIPLKQGSATFGTGTAVGTPQHNHWHTGKSDAFRVI